MDPNALGPGLFLAMVFLAILAVVIVLRFIPIGLWITALASGVRVSFKTLFGMRFRKVNPANIVNPLINAHKAGLALPINCARGTHYLAGGNVERVVRALISADKAGIPLDFKQATAIDLAGRDVFEAVQVSVNPKVITTPKVAAMAKDGIQLLAMARVTVRANINRLVGGAGEETILARVGEGIVSTIGSAASHKALLENPDLISKTVLGKGLDSGTAFEILSIDIADVDVGDNVGARLQTEQAEANTNIAQAAAIDLAGRDVLEAVKMSVNPKVIDTPRVAAMAKDGIQLIATARVTVRGLLTTDKCTCTLIYLKVKVKSGTEYIAA